MSNRRKNSILIVDDERDNISSLTAILGPDHTIYASTDGKDSIETAEKFLPDIILLDVLMPEMDGYDVITVLKNSEKTRDIPVIFITGLDNTNAEIKGLALGAVDYIVKPFHPAIVKLRVQHHIQLIERLRQQKLMTKIAHNFLASAQTNTLHTDALRMVGEFMGITTILLYKLEANSNTLVCKNEWLNPEINLETRIGDKIELNDKIISDVNNLLTENEKDICLNSKKSLLKESIKINKPHIDNFITTPIYIKGKMRATLVFSKEDSEQEWSESEKGFAVLLASIFSGVFERDAMQNSEFLSRAKSLFLSRMNHEMRTPMNAIIGMLQVFDVIGVPDNIKDNCKAMNDAAHTLMRLINDVLDISDMEYGAYMVTNAAFDFKTMIWDILRIADNNASKRRQYFDCKVDPEIPVTLIGDEKNLRQIITTLLANAVKFTPEKGEINFDARLINDDNGIITLQIEVSDNGIGISKEQQDKLFSIFEQADGSLSREYGGIGLGLALSKRIIEMMDGDIWVESELGKGSKFYLTCKLKKA